MERISLLVVSFALFSIGAYELVTWPAWGLNTMPLFLLLGRTFRQLYAAAEIVSATIFAIFGIFGVYFVAAGPESKHTGDLKLCCCIPFQFSSTLQSVSWLSEANCWLTMLCWLAAWESFGSGDGGVVEGAL